MNILITGGTGFLGSSLARSLADKNKIKVIARGQKRGFLSDVELNEFSFTKCDIRDKGLLQKVVCGKTDLVIHCAGKIEIKNRSICLEELVKVNLNSTIGLIQVMLEKNINKLLFCSSMTVYDPDNKIPIKENSHLNPMHFYGLTKKWAEEAIARYAQDGLIKALIIRYPGLYGYPRRAGYIYHTARKLLNNEDVTVNTNGLGFWETMNIESATKITTEVLNAWEWKTGCGILNCSYGQEIDFLGVAFKIKEILNSSASVKTKKPLGYRKFYMDNTKIKKIIGWHFSFEPDLQQYLEKYGGWILQ